jgi:hypothetical protein
MIGITTGARAEDLHALLFDCLRPDPHDKRFMLFTFWQNKVSRWNTKPLLTTDPAHRAMIELIEAQQDRVRQRHGHATKYLFPIFYGKRDRSSVTTGPCRSSGCCASGTGSPMAKASRSTSRGIRCATIAGRRWRPTATTS